MFYSRITDEKMNEAYLRSLVYEVKKMIQEIRLKSRPPLDASVYFS